MRYENRIPVEGINTPARHPVREFFRLACLGIVALVLLGLVLNYTGAKLGGLVPFKAELWLSRQIDRVLVESGQESPFTSNKVDSPVRRYLQSITDKVVSALELDDSMQITLHYSEENITNAYATIGGHVYIFKGLLSLIPHENALAMLLAHEISHVQLRHTAMGVGSGLAVALGGSVVTSGSRLEGRLFDLASLSFSREMESDADKAGLLAVQKIYGHVEGASDLFALFMELREDDSDGLLDSFYSTHPLDAERIDSLASYARSQQWLTQGEISVLPAELNRWIESQ